MADFCKQCNEELFGVAEADFGFDPATKLEPGEGFMVLCEGCGPTLVSHDGTCMMHDAHNELEELKCPA